MNDDRIPRRTWQLDAFIDVIGLTPRAPLVSFPGKCSSLLQYSCVSLFTDSRVIHQKLQRVEIVSYMFYT